MLKKLSRVFLVFAVMLSMTVNAFASETVDNADIFAVVPYENNIVDGDYIPIEPTISQVVRRYIRPGSGWLSVIAGHVPLFPERIQIALSADSGGPIEFRVVPRSGSPIANFTLNPGRNGEFRVNALQTYSIQVRHNGAQDRWAEFTVRTLQTFP